jgi:hypothetical protein
MGATHSLFKVCVHQHVGIVQRQRRCRTVTWMAAGHRITRSGSRSALMKVRSRRGVDVALREFTAMEGADDHCQVNNLRLAHLVIFDWLERVFVNEPGDVRLRC